MLVNKAQDTLNASQFSGAVYFRCEHNQFFYQTNVTQGLEYGIQASDFLSEGIDKHRVQEFF